MSRSTIQRAVFAVTAPVVAGLAVAAPIAIAAAALAIAAPAAAAQDRPASPEAGARLRAADSAAIFSIKLRDGSSFVGRLQRVRGDSASLVSSAGTLVVAIADVVSAVPVRPQDMQDGEYWFPNPNLTRLLFAPTARMLKRGEGYFSDHMVFFPGVAVGITDRVTIGGGMSIFPGAGIDDQVFYVTPKVGVVQGDRFNVAVGALAMKLGFNDSEDPYDDGDGDHVGVLYSVATYGSERGSVTGGIGYGYVGDELSDTPALMFGADARASRRVALVTENYLFAGEESVGLLSGGVRFFGEKLAVDLGLVTPVGEGEVFFFPFVGFIVNF